ncbi:G-protein alpha subunit-domain-containing protein [Mycena capillaripes]|nr:G-protein alpha subunit-domain-containing protein [Mycena capillaripes]
MAGFSARRKAATIVASAKARSEVIDAKLRQEQSLRSLVQFVPSFNAGNYFQATFIEQARVFNSRLVDRIDEDEPATAQLKIPLNNEEPIYDNSSSKDTASDVARCKLPSPAVTETPFEVQVTHSLSGSVDHLNTILTCVHREIGLQRKWFSCFNEVEAIVFLVDLSSYDQTTVSEETGKSVNRVREVMSQFEDACTRRYSARPTIVLIMNKMDVFTSKLAVSPLSTCFPEYRGANASGAATEYCIKRFLSLLPEQLSSRAWCTTAIDADQMAGAF